ETAGSDRPVKKVRSDFADASVVSEVTFDFALGERVFRVHRSADHPRPGAATARPGSVTLWQIEPEGTGAAVGHGSGEPSQRETLRVLATKKGDVADEIAALLGFHAEQFRQVVLIPQGEFRRLLLADSRDREKILETLFGTELYRRIEDALKEARNDLVAEIKREQRGVEVLLEQAAVDSLEVLRERARQEDAHLAECNERETAARAAEHDASTRAAAAEKAAAAAAELRQAEAELSVLAGQQTEHDRRRLTLQRARAAQAVAAQQAAHQAAAARTKAAADAANSASQALSLAECAKAAATDARVVEEGRAAEREEATARVRRLEEAVARAARAADLRTRLADAEVHLADAAGAAARSDREVNYELARCDELERELAGVREVVAKAEPRRAAVREATEIDARLGTLAQTRSQLIRQSVVIGGLEAELRRIDAAIGELRRRQRDARARWAAGQAAALALTLEEGRACPVCGSLEHPSPAVADAAGIGDAEIEALQSELDEAEREREASAARLGAAREQGAGLRAGIDELARGLGDWADADAGRAAAALAQARQSLVEVGLAENRRREIEAALTARRAAIEEAESDRERARKLAEDARVRCAELRGQLEEADRQAAATDVISGAAADAITGAATDAITGAAADAITGAAADAITGAATDATARRATDATAGAATDATARAASDDATGATLLAGELERARAAASWLDKAAEQARAGEIRATAELASAREVDGRAAREDALARAALEDTRAVFEAALAREGFAGADQARAAHLAGAELDALEAGLAAFDGAIAGATSRVERARAASTGAAAPDLEAARERARAAKRAFQEVVVARAAGAAALGVTQSALRTLEAAAARLDALERRYLVVGHVADVAAGRNDAGISLLRFVLAALLDDVLASASERLRRMSQQRFALARAGDRRDRRSSGGLDLEVYDAHTGVARPVATLSGGESFLASLSLALGLADVVQSYAGGIRLETIFIDEGFGTLDPEALDLAMRTLEDLQAGGRLVGIISHVPELKERVPARLEVTPGARGSSARFVIG
ncbi:MAG: SMC family ATPase, partial [Deltaproteobacteria bacterium]|nr:SMC family ATPase [Deltaproteobacteria bacterium]